ncbi:MAG: gliding motility-associated C-terminal domain-containing protein, partial [Chitinophagaceae bacterium]
DGSYTVANRTNNCFGATWHSVLQDHTPGDVDGYMMVINASFSPGDFFVKTVDGLCPNTTYEFAAWILNVVKQSSCGGATIKPNVTFNIETTSGTVLQSYKTGDISAGSFPEWKQHGFFFTTTTAISSVVLRITNNAPGGCGNDLLLDDITFRACGPLVTANINGSPDSVDVCAGNTKPFTLQANVSSGYSDPVYQWQVSTDNGGKWTNIAGAVNITYILSQTNAPATYLYRFAVSQRSNMNISSCYVLSNIVTIIVNKNPVIAASNTGSCEGDTLSLRANDGVLFAWTGPLNFTSDLQSPFIPNASQANSGTYYVKVTSAKGCISTDSTVASIALKPIVNAGIDAEICEGKSIQLSGNGTNVTSYQWSPAPELSNATISNPIATPKQTNLFILTVANNKCKSSDSVLITVNANAKANAGSDKAIIEGQSVVLNGMASGTDITFTWSPTTNMTGSTTLNPTVKPLVNEIYTLTVVSNKGCGTATDSVLIKVYKDLYIPNAFTPNNDGLNDRWNIETLQAFPQADVRVFNRFGEMVFHNKGINISWDGKFKGKVASSGAYVYIIDLKNKSQVIKGVLFILL